MFLSRGSRRPRFSGEFRSPFLQEGVFFVVVLFFFFVLFYWVGCFCALMRFPFLLLHSTSECPMYIPLPGMSFFILQFRSYFFLSFSRHPTPPRHHSFRILLRPRRACVFLKGARSVFSLLFSSSQARLPERISEPLLGVIFR